MPKLKVKLQWLESSQHRQMPRAMSLGASGMDLCAEIAQPESLRPMERKLIPCGFSIAIPEGFEAQIRPRSGLAFRDGITCLNTPGTIDCDYRGEIKVLLINLGQKAWTLEPGDRIAQMVFQKVERVEFDVVESLEDSVRGEGGFGSTGLKKMIS